MVLEGPPVVLFSLTELEHHPILFDVTYAPGEILFDEGLSQAGPLRAEGQAELLRNTAGEIRVRGHLAVEMEGACDRCLEAARFPVDEEFDLFYRPVPKKGGHGEVHLADGEIDLAFYEGEGVSLRDVLREQILLSLPMQLFCRADCRGLCPTCGANRNLAPCGCPVAPRDPRLSGLDQIE
jgi:uncharacterized protein